MSFGLAFAGGGTKGATHVGVLKALEEFKLKPSCLAGTSAGSIVAGLYAIVYSISEMENIIEYLSKKGIFLLDPNYKKIAFSIVELFAQKSISISGLIKGKKLEKYLCDITDNIHISKTKIQLIIPTVDLTTGMTIAYTNKLNNLKNIKNVIWKNDIKLGSAMYASSAIPVIFEPKIIGKMCLVDGGVTDVLPVDLLAATYEPNIVAVDISNEYEMPENHGIFEIASHSLSVMRDYLLKNKWTHSTISIKPELPENSGIFTFNQMNKCMECGYISAKKIIMENISKFH